MAAPESRTAFVSNINYRTIGKTLGDALVKFGPIESVHIVTEWDGRQERSRGFGFVEFKTRAGLDAAIAGQDDLNVDDRPLRIRVSQPRPRVTAFVLGIPAETTNEDILDAFKDYHPTEVRIVARAYERARGFAFVTFATEDDQARAVGDHRDVGIALKGGTSLVRFARRRFSGGGGGEGGGRGAGRGRGFGGGWGRRPWTRRAPAADRSAPRDSAPRAPRGGARQPPAARPAEDDPK